MPNYYNPYYQQPNMYQMQPQMQNGGFVPVRNEFEARNYPVAPGNSVTFKDESAPYIYTKTMGLSQFDAPKFDKYKLVKEVPSEPSEMPQNSSFDDKPIWNSIDKLKAEIGAMQSEIEAIRNDYKSKSEIGRNTKRSDNGDD